MKNKYNVINWIVGNLFCMLGIAFSTKANFGLSMIASGPFILHTWLKESLSWFTQGTAEYFYEALILLITCLIIKKFKPRYLLSFAEAMLAGFILDGWLYLLGGNGQYESMLVRICAFAIGLLCTAFGVALFFRTTLPLQTYDLAVVEISKELNKPVDKIKQIFDFSMLGFSVLLSLVLTKKLTGIGVGTVILTVFNSLVIKMFGKLIDKVECK